MSRCYTFAESDCEQREGSPDVLGREPRTVNSAVLSRAFCPNTLDTAWTRRRKVAAQPVLAKARKQSSRTGRTHG
jgi:hypothetical protein